MTARSRQRAESSIVALHAYVKALLVKRAADPRDDVISMLAADGTTAGSAAGAAGGAIDAEERLALVVNLIGGAVGSSRAAIVNSVLALVRHPAQADRPRADRTLLRAAIEECLRLHPPFRVGRRKTVEPVAAFERPCRWWATNPPNCQRRYRDTGTHADSCENGLRPWARR